MRGRVRTRESERASQHVTRAANKQEQHRIAPKYARVAPHSVTRSGSERNDSRSRGIRSITSKQTRGQGRRRSWATWHGDEARPSTEHAQSLAVDAATQSSQQQRIPHDKRRGRRHSRPGQAAKTVGRGVGRGWYAAHTGGGVTSPLTPAAAAVPSQPRHTMPVYVFACQGHAHGTRGLSPSKV